MDGKRQSKVCLDNFDAAKDFQRGAGIVRFSLWYLVKVFFFLTALPFPSGFKVLLLRMFGAKVGRGLTLKPRVNIHFPWKLSIGDYVWIGEEVCILNFETVSIGNHVCLSQRVFLCGGNHDFRDPAFSYRNGPIVLEDGCWLGAGCFAGPGVTVGTDAVAAAGSVITSDLSPNGVYKGNPLIYVTERWK